MAHPHVLFIWKFPPSGLSSGLVWWEQIKAKMRNEFAVPIGLMVVWVVSDSPGSLGKEQSKKIQGFVSQILWHYLAKEGCVQKLFYCLIPIKEPCVRKYEGLPRSKILGILQTETWLISPSKCLFRSCFVCVHHYTIVFRLSDSSINCMRFLFRSTSAVRAFLRISLKC